VYSLLPRDAFFAIADESKRQHIPFVGHVPSTVRASEASDAGMKSMEHLLGVLLESSTNEEAIRKDLVAAAEEAAPASALMRVSRRHAKESIETYDPAKAAALFARFVKNGTWHCPTLTVNRAVAYMDDPAFTSDQRVRYMPSSIRAFWDPKNDFRFKELTPEDFANRKRTFAKLMEIAGAMQKAGVGILAGTDTLNPYCFPGFSLHDELALLVQAGLTPLQALQAATRNPARFLENDDYGAVANGKMADLVLLDANPLQDIHNTTKIAAVIFNGKYFSRSDLDDMLSAVEKIEGQ
jgi:imidazolonepropionase-like amidohydrolase